MVCETSSNGTPSREENCEDHTPRPKQSVCPSCAASCCMEANGIVKLNVGGKKFLTSRETILARKSMLAIMYNNQGKFSNTKDAEGYTFIDRDGERFSHILNFLRSGSLPSFDAAWRYEEVLEEADFFSMDELAEVCREKLADMEAAKESADNCIDKRCEIHVVEPLAYGGGRGVASTPRRAVSGGGFVGGLGEYGGQGLGAAVVGIGTGLNAVELLQEGDNNSFEFTLDEDF